MRRAAIFAVCLALLGLVVSPLAPLAATEPGRIEGRVAGPEDAGLGGVTVTLEALGRSTLTDAEGRYAFDRVPAGEQALAFRLDPWEAQETVTVAEGAVAEVTTRVDWRPSFAETLTVEAASRQSERVVEAPSAVTVLGADEVARQAVHGELPRLLAGTPGVDLVQNGVYDWSLNARGFNRPVNRRILTLLDGRDPSLAILAGGQEWGALVLPLDELARVELVRGPGAALYGAGAFNGVLSLITRTPRESRGARLRLTAGELDTRRLDARWAGAAGQSWIKLVGSRQESEDFVRSRVSEVEYEPLPREALAPPRDHVRAGWLSARLDRELGRGGRLLTFEAGEMDHAGITTVTESGRVQRQDIRGPWGRFELSDSRWDLLGTYTRRDSDRELFLSTGFEEYFEESRLTLELKRTAELPGNRGRVSAGAAHGELRVDTESPQGLQTLFARPRTARYSAVFGQVSYDLGPSLKAVASLRWDESTLHDDRTSPRAALVWAVHPRHTLRLSWSSAFQSPTLSDAYLDLPVAAPLDLSALEQGLAPVLGGTRLGLESVPLVAAGNPELGIEKITSAELGYSAILGRSALLTINVYRSEIEDFVTPLIFTAGTSLGLFARDVFDPWQPPASLSPEASQAVLAALSAALPPNLFAVLSQRPDGSPFIPLLSYTNFGRVETRGAEVGLNADFAPWRLDLSYTWFDFDVREAAAESPLEANAPENQIGLGVAHHRGRFDAAMRGRWVDGYRWQAGLFAGEVPSYTVVDLSGSADLGGHWHTGIDVTNLLDDSHYEIYGGNLVGRRALLHVTYEW